MAAFPVDHGDHGSDFTGDDVRDIPALPTDVSAGLPGGNEWVPNPGI